MDSKPNHVYEDFEVHTEWVHEAVQDTLIAYLPGFKAEQLKVEVTTGGKLRISGERPIRGNKFSRFKKEIPLPSNCDQNKIRASFSDGMLHVKHPKPIVPADEQLEQAKPSAQVPKSDQDDLAAQPPGPREQSNGPEQAVQEAPPKASMEKQAGEKTDELAKEADNVGEKAADTEMEMKDKTNASNGSDKRVEKEKKAGEKTDELAKEADNVGEKAADTEMEMKDKTNASNGSDKRVEKEKKAGEKTDELAKEADNVGEKAADTEMEMKDKTNASNGSDKPVEKEKNGWDQEEKTSSSEEREKLDDSIEDAAEKETVKNKKLDGSDIYQLGINLVSLKYKQVLEGFAMELKNPRKMINKVLSVLLLVVLAVYLRNAIKYLRNH